MEVFYALVSLLLSLYFFSHSTIILATKTNIINSNPKSTTINLVHSSLIVPKHGDSIRRMKNYGSPDSLIIEQDLLPTEDLLFFINVTLGTPPVPQFTIFDTGSKIIWVSCYPCIKLKCRETPPVYRRFYSSTFMPMRCDNVICPQISNYRCDAARRCPFSTRYASDTKAAGFMGIDQMSFQEPDGNEAGLRLRQSFGCATDVNEGRVNDMNFQGVFGLGMYTGSILEQFGGKFTYCIESLDNSDRRRKTKAQVRFGNVDWEGSSASLEIWKANAGVYSVRLVNISFGDHSLGVKPHDAVLDTGTEYTWLSRDYFDELRERVKTLVKKLGLEELKVYRDSRLCFKGKVNSDLIRVPNMKLQFPYDDSDSFAWPWRHWTAG